MARMSLILSALALVMMMTQSCRPSEPPLIATGDAIRITSTGATLTGNVEDMGDATALAIRFDWGEDRRLLRRGNTRQPTVTAAGSFEADLTGLEPGTTYHYRAHSTIPGGLLGAVHSFTTLPAPPTPRAPPAVTTEDVGDASGTRATMGGSLTHLGSSPSVTVSFVYGTTAGGPHTQESESLVMREPGRFTIEVTGLTPDTTHYYRAKAIGHGQALGAEVGYLAWTTPPSVASFGAGQITATEASLYGLVKDMGTADRLYISFVWGTTPGGPYDYDSGQWEVFEPGMRTANLRFLEPGTTYYFRPIAEGDGAAWGDEMSFTTETPAVFNDRSLEVAIRQAVGKPTGDVYVSDLAALTELSLRQMSITNLTGLENCRNLRFLDLRQNDVSDLLPLASLFNLQTVDLSRNRISDISALAGLSALSSLALGVNQIVDISPLLDNVGLSDGDMVGLTRNPLSAVSRDTWIPQLRRRGVDVRWW